MKSNSATPTPFGSVSCFVIGVCLSNYKLNSFLIHHASYSKWYQWYLMHREVLGSIWKIGRYPIKVSEVLCVTLGYKSYLSAKFTKTFIVGLTACHCLYNHGPPTIDTILLCIYMYGDYKHFIIWGLVQPRFPQLHDPSVGPSLVS